LCLFRFFLPDTPLSDLYSLSLHDALPILLSSTGLFFKAPHKGVNACSIAKPNAIHTAKCPISTITTAPLRRYRKIIGLCSTTPRSEEHTSELQSRFDLVCRLLLEKKKHQT